jgi:FdhD protein
MYQQEFETIVINAKGFRKSTFTAAVEATIRLYINNKPVSSILASPAQLEQLAVGYLVCEGIIKDTSDIKDITISNSSLDSIEIRSVINNNINLQHNENVKVNSDTRFNADVIRKSIHYLESGIYQQTRGTHAACIIDINGCCIARAVDVGRHNAVDKAIGQALMDGYKLDEHFILSTGRQPAGMVHKAARVGISVIVTKAAPLNTGIEAARQSGICLIGLATEKTMTIFSHWYRIAVLY